MDISRDVWATAIIAGLVAALVGCGSSQSEPATSNSASTSAAPVTTGSPPPTAPAADAVHGTSNAKTYTAAPSKTEGATPDGNGKWTLVVDLVSGGDDRVADALNQAVQNSAKEQLESFKRDAGTDGTWTFDTQPELHFGGASIAELITGTYMHAGAAHPLLSTGTVVIDSRSARPITLSDLFTDKNAGLKQLSEQSKLLLPAVLNIPAPMGDEPGNAPTEANFANWIPTPAGMEIHFADYQFGHGRPVITVPWSALDRLLAPGMEALRQPG